MPLNIYLSFHEAPSYTTQLVFRLKQLDTESVPRGCQVPLHTVFVEGTASRIPSELFSASHVVSTRDAFAELTKQYTTTTL